MNSYTFRRQWESAAPRRRLLLLLIIAATTSAATGFMAYVLPHKGNGRLELILLIFFAMLFAWISIGFWTSLAGFVMLLVKKDAWKIGNMPEQGTDIRGPLPRTAVLLPVYNEDTARVFTGVEIIFRSMEKTGHSGTFDFFILSDSTNPDIQLREEAAWYKCCSEMNGFGRIFYRHRSPNIKRKSGNIADFCRRWGRSYTYMIVLDADSIMYGETMVRLVRLMEQHPGTGIIQTRPIPTGKNSVAARVQQFASSMYGPMFSAGLHFWQLGDGQYWGHNAVIRIAPFMRHCALPRLSGKPPLGGEILSHDFVEAAMMRRAGWEVWLAYDMEGSYEEPPATLIEELLRDRRWCQGNLQHLRLLLTKGLMPAHRFLFLNGAMSYISALLWFCFLSLSTAEAISMVVFEPDYFPREGSLFPHWPVWDPSWLLILLASTMSILFLPKILALILVLINRKRMRSFGGFFKTVFNLFSEILLSAVLAPIRMFVHSKFVAITILGGKTGWTPPDRGEKPTDWKTAFRFHFTGSFIAFLWGSIMFLINPGFFYWISPIVIPLILSIPISVFTSRPWIGRKLRRLGLFTTPPEQEQPRELAMLEEKLASAGPAVNTRKTVQKMPGVFAETVIDPLLLSIHITAQRGEGSAAEADEPRRLNLVEKALTSGPESLSASEKRQLLSDAAGLQLLHEKIWEISDDDLASKWGL